jgi:hypothetical protein
MSRWPTVLPALPKGTKTNEAATKVLFAQSRIWQVTGMVTHGRRIRVFEIYVESRVWGGEGLS